MVSNPTGAWLFVHCECCVLSARGLCDGLITRSEESYRLWCVVMWSGNLVNEEALAHWGLSRQKQTTVTALVVIWILKKTIKRETNTYIGCGGRALLIFIHWTKWKWSASSLIRFIPAERDPISIVQEMRVPQSRSQVWMFWRRQNLIAPTGIRNEDHRAPMLVTILTELSRQKLEVYFHNVRTAAAI